MTTSYPSHAGDWAGHFVREEALELVTAGFAVTVLTSRTVFCDEGVRVIDLDAASATMSAFGAPGARERIRRFPPRVFSAAIWAFRVRRTLAFENFDRVIAHWAVPSAWPATQNEVEVVSHGGDVRLIASLPFVMRCAIARDVASRATTWRFVAESLKRELLDSVDGDTARRIEAIAIVREPALHIPDVAQRAESIRAELGSFDLSVGRLVASKRVERAIDRAAAVRANLVVVGDGPERAALERRARTAGARVRFLGDLPRHEALAYLAAAETLVFASNEEGCSTILREARALETRVEIV